MAESSPQEQIEVKLDSAPPEPTKTRPKRKRRFSVDKDKFVAYVLACVSAEEDNWSNLIDRRKTRRAKLMGWAQTAGPWDGSSDVNIPIMQIANLNVRGMLENALKAQRPMLESKATQKRNTTHQKAIDRILDNQFFVENKGESLIDDFCANFVEDEAAYLYTQWVKETDTYHDVRLLPGLDTEQPIEIQALMLLKELFPNLATEKMIDNDGWEWEVTTNEPGEALPRVSSCKFWETDDGMLEAHIVSRMTTFNGPCVSVPDFEDIIYPARSANLQPPMASNPNGAPWVARFTVVSKDTIERRIKDHTYDQIKDESPEEERIDAGKSDINSGEQSEEPKEQKDLMAGIDIASATEHDPITQIVWYGRWDVNGDGLEEDIIAWILRDTKVLCKVTLLSEIYPGLPIRRPFSAASYIPTSNRVLGMSQSEFLESFQDAMKTALDQHLNWGEITNTPFFTYRAASGMKAEPIRIEPGMGYPLDDPQRDIAFPTWPTKDSTFAINTITMLQQYVERIEPLSNDTSLGRIPMGRSSALRNTGSLMAMLGQTNKRAEQILRRMFAALSDCFSMMHRLNRRFLPDHKEVRVIGKSEQSEDAYLTIKRENLDADVDFEFKGTLLNTDKAQLAAAMDQILALVISPVAFQAGMVTFDEMYTAFANKCRALDQDPDLYFKRPPAMWAGPKLMAEEVISTILAGEQPQGQPMEPPQIHLQKLMAFTQTNEFGFYGPPQVEMLKQWMAAIQQRLMQEQQMMMAMQQFQQQQPGGEQTPGMQAQPPDIGPGSNGATGPNQKLDETIGVQDRMKGMQ